MLCYSQVGALQWACHGDSKMFKGKLNFGVKHVQLTMYTLSLVILTIH